MLAALMLPSIAQTLTPSVRATTGGVTTGGGGSLSATMGETFIASYSSGSAMLTQGQQQPEVTFRTGSVPTSICVGTTISIPFTLKGIFGATHTITAQLSNSTGSFASPVTLGSLNATTSGSLSVVIPSNTPVGSGYRIRMVCNYPVLIASNNGSDITMHSLPTATGTTPAAIACNGGTSTVSISASGGSGTYSGTGTFTIGAGASTFTVTDNYGCTATKAVTVTQPNIITFTLTVTNPSPCTSSTGRLSITAAGGTSPYNYAKNGGASPTWATSGLFQNLPAATYNAEVRDKNLCLSSIVPRVVGCLARELEAETDLSVFNVFPNPATNHLTLNFNSGNTDNYTIRLIDIFGRVVYTQNDASALGSNQVQLNVEDIANGMYLVTLQNGNNLLQKKVLIDK